MTSQVIPLMAASEMSSSVALAALVLVMGFGHHSAGAQTSCKEFAEVKAAIDTIIDKDAAKGAAFRKEFKEGSDSIHIVEQMVDAATAKKIDICRYDVAEYLTKRGFPPPH